MKKISLMIPLLLAGISLAQPPERGEPYGGETGSYQPREQGGPEARREGKAPQAAPQGRHQGPEEARAPEQKAAPKEQQKRKDDKVACKKIGSFTACYDD